MPELRTPEWISVVLAFFWFSMLACRRRALDRGRRAKIIVLGLVVWPGGVAITILASVVLPRLVPPRPARIAFISTSVSLSAPSPICAKERRSALSRNPTTYPKGQLLGKAAFG